MSVCIFFLKSLVNKMGHNFLARHRREFFPPLLPMLAAAEWYVSCQASVSMNYLQKKVYFTQEGTKQRNVLKGESFLAETEMEIQKSQYRSSEVLGKKAIYWHSISMEEGLCPCLLAWDMLTWYDTISPPNLTTGYDLKPVPHEDTLSLILRSFCWDCPLWQLKRLSCSSGVKSVASQDWCRVDGQAGVVQRDTSWRQCRWPEENVSLAGLEEGHCPSSSWEWKWRDCQQREERDVLQSACLVESLVLNWCMFAKKVVEM